MNKDRISQSLGAVLAVDTYCNRTNSQTERWGNFPP